MAQMVVDHRSGTAELECDTFEIGIEPKESHSCFIYQYIQCIQSIDTFPLVVIYPT